MSDLYTRVTSKPTVPLQSFHLLSGLASSLSKYLKLFDCSPDSLMQIRDHEWRSSGRCVRD